MFSTGHWFVCGLNSFRNQTDILLLLLNSLNSPHNLSVTTHMLEQVGIGLPDVDGAVIGGKKLNVDLLQL